MRSSHVNCKKWIELACNRRIIATIFEHPNFPTKRETRRHAHVQSRASNCVHFKLLFEKIMIMCIGFYDLNEFLWTYTSDAAVAVFNFCIHLSCHCGPGICQKGLFGHTRTAKSLVRLRIMRSRPRHCAI